jgi:hypothetical protein
VACGCGEVSDPLPEQTLQAPAGGRRPPTSDAPSPAVPDRAVAVVDDADRALTGALPLLEEIPELAAALAMARGVDRLIAQLVDAIGQLERHDVAGSLTGLDLEHWLASVAGRTRTDRRMLLVAADRCARLRSLREAFVVQATISWAQARAIICLVEPLPRTRDAQIDDAIGPVLARAAGIDPDDLLHAVRIAIRDLRFSEHATTPDPTATFAPFLAMQPRLDGTGGQLFGELDALGFATVDAALTAATDRGAATPGTADAGGDDPTHGDSDPDHTHGFAAARQLGGRGTAQQRAARLVELCDSALTHGDWDPTSTRGGDGSAMPTGPVGSGDGPMVSRPQLLIRAELPTLLDRDQVPAALLTTLTGGHLALDAPSLRRLVETRGADVRTIVLDDHGAIVGVGRRRRLPPGWLTDATTALHDTCSHPGCRRGVRGCDTDHAAPWHPARPDDPPGRTDLDQLAPLCRFHNRTKESDSWRVTQQADGTRTWHHGSTGLTTRTLPATWRPPPDGPAP